ncbi:Universal stress protein family [Chondromyces apiculatus DSM 436]|uniref:Universal stress protein family n=1 Tax=Chondromyces apiculatus DSM 436 TaxID=1192034 RepID=A0A017TBG9_9BACT|nr:Universal stress protein family [Chondromyces apiculatus DSM 436]
MATSRPATDTGSTPSGRRLRCVKPYIVVVAMDLSEPGGRAWRFAFDLADMRGETEIHAVVVGPKKATQAWRDATTPQVAPPAPSSSAPPSLRVLQHQSASGQARLMAMHFRVGRPDRAIVGLAEELGADLVVIGMHPTSLLQRLLGGCTAERIARNAPCPVVVVRQKRNDTEEEPAPAWMPAPPSHYRLGAA